MKIAFCGKSGSGKSYYSNILIKDYNYVKKSFATPVKNIAKTILLYEITNDNKPKINEFGITNRELCLFISDTFKKLKKEVFSDIMKKEIEQEVNNNIVIDDLRFDYEAEMLFKKGFKIIEIFSDSFNVIDHESEKGIDKKYIKLSLFNDKKSCPNMEEILKL